MEEAHRVEIERVKAAHAHALQRFADDLATKEATVGRIQAELNDTHQSLSYYKLKNEALVTRITEVKGEARSAMGHYQTQSPLMPSMLLASSGSTMQTPKMTPSHPPPHLTEDGLNSSSSGGGGAELFPSFAGLPPTAFGGANARQLLLTPQLSSSSSLSSSAHGHFSATLPTPLQSASFSTYTHGQTMGGSLGGGQLGTSFDSSSKLARQQREIEDLQHRFDALQRATELQSNIERRRGEMQRAREMDLDPAVLAELTPNATPLMRSMSRSQMMALGGVGGGGGSASFAESATPTQGHSRSSSGSPARTTRDL